MLRPSAAATAAFLALFTLSPTNAGDAVKVDDPYVRVLGAGPGAAYFTIENLSDEPDRLVSVATDPGSRAELHTEKMDANGMMTMAPIEGGIALPPKSQHALSRGGDHVMLFNLPRLAEGAEVTLTLTFERAGTVTVEAPVDNTRKPGAGETMPGMAGN